MPNIEISTVMLIDDAEIDQKSYRRVLKKSGIVGDVIMYAYADEALDYLSKSDSPRIEVIFLDINMPRMNGYEFLEAATDRLGNDFAKVIIVMLTTSIDPDDKRRAESHPLVKDFLNKPLTVDDVRRVAKLLRT